MSEDIEALIIAAFEEMIQAELPVEEFSPNEDKTFDWVFSRGLTEEEQKKALEISQKYLPGNYSLWAATA